MMFSSKTLIPLWAIFAHHIPTALAAGCWRDTTCTGPSSAAFPGAWDKYNYAPSSRTVLPINYSPPGGGAVTNFPSIDLATLSGSNTQLIFDFGQEVGGIVTVVYSAVGTGNLGLAFSEASNFTGPASDSSNGNFHTDGALFTTVSTTQEANYTMPLASLRGGFRYLTVFTQSVASDNLAVTIHDVTVELAFQPTWTNLRAYQGYFSCSDPLLNQVWYAGAYTLQTNAVPSHTGRAFPIINNGWSNDYDLSLRTGVDSVYVDGSKRDRTVWPGDLLVAVPSILVSTGDWQGIYNTLEVIYNDQTSAGELPFAGPGIQLYGSDTYHMATMIGTYDYFLWTNDGNFLSTTYPKYQKAMAFITGKIDSTGLLFVTGNNDWGRVNQGGHNSEANMMLYHVLTTGSQLATWAGDSASSTTWAQQAATLKTAVNAMNFDTAAGAFKDDDKSTLIPQDANALSLFYGIAPASLTSSISTALTKTWIAIGAPAPELPNNLVGLGQSLEVKGHFAVHQTSRALDLIRRAWGWYLSSPFGTRSTCIEGYLTDGTFGYRSAYGYANDPSYTSHAHGWSTGPTAALSSYIVGLTITAPGGSAWSLEPQFGDLSEAEAGFTTPLGQFSAKWQTVDGGYTVQWNMPEGTTGTVILPGSAKGRPSVMIDGMARGLDDTEFDFGTNAVKLEIGGGEHSVNVVY